MSKYDDTYNSRTHDSLSAFLDNEASPADIEVLLLADKDDLANKLDRYHQIQQCVQTDSEHLIFDSGAFLAGVKDKLKEDVSDNNVVAFPHQNVMQKANIDAAFADLDKRPVSTTTVPTPRRSLWSGFAVAASVAVAVVLGGNLLLGGANSDIATPAFATSNIPVVEQQTPSVQKIDSRANLENNERLQNYLRQHAQQASMTVGQGMIPMARVVSYPQGVER